MKKYMLLFISMLSALVFSANPQGIPSPPSPPQECKSLTIRNDSETTIYCCFYNNNFSLIAKTKEISPNRRMTILKQPNLWENVAIVSIFQIPNQKEIKGSLSSENSLITFTKNKKIEIK